MQKRVSLNPIQVEALLTVIDYSWVDEEADYACNRCPNHIFCL